MISVKVTESSLTSALTLLGKKAIASTSGTSSEAPNKKRKRGPPKKDRWQDDKALTDALRSYSNVASVVRTQVQDKYLLKFKEGILYYYNCSIFFTNDQIQNII